MEERKRFLIFDSVIWDREYEGSSNRSVTLHRNNLTDRSDIRRKVLRRMTIMPPASNLVYNSTSGHISTPPSVCVSHLQLSARKSKRLWSSEALAGGNTLSETWVIGPVRAGSVLLEDSDTALAVGSVEPCSVGSPPEYFTGHSALGSPQSVSRHRHWHHSRT